MNGEFAELYNKLHVDLETLKATYKERWDNHDERAGELQEAVKEINVKVSGLPCGIHEERVKNQIWKVNLLWVVVIILGVIKGYFLVVP